jgi:putative membrane-bound dehydrogenase-like protein
VELEVLVLSTWLEACQVLPTALEALISRASSVLTLQIRKCQTLENHPKVPANGTIALALGTLGKGCLRSSHHSLENWNKFPPWGCIRVMRRLLFLLAATTLHAARPDVPLPEGVTVENGARFVDLNGDGFDDLVFSNSERYGVLIFNDVEKKNLGWLRGWTHVMREGKAGDANALPLTTRGDVEFKDGAMWVAGKRHLSHAELLRPPAPAPRTPEESMKAIHLKPGFEIELVAAEPLVQDPIFVDWDDQGRMWVVEMADYPFHEYQGVTRGGRVKVLTDENGDGRYEKAATFLDDLLYPTGLALWKNGAFIASVPDVFYAEDTDGDGHADKRTPVLSGFHKGNPQHLVNGFAWGLDGWLYGGNGDSGGKVVEVKSGREFDLSGRDFRFHPETHEFQLLAGRAQYGRWRDDFGNWFSGNNSNLGWHYFLEDRYLARNPRLAVPTLKQNLNTSGTKVFPVSTPVRRLNQPQSVNTLTSGCSVIPYRDTLFGPGYENSLFICEPANNLVHREVLVPDGISFTSRRAGDEQDREFLASEDHWSRFTQARTGPDGCLYVVDFYRLILEHPEWIPPQMLAHLDLYAGGDKGRIYRVRPAGPARAVHLGLDSPNGPARDIAQRLLIQQKAAWSTESLHERPAIAVQQLWTMHTLGTLKPAHLLGAFKSPSAHVREHAIRIAENHPGDSSLLTALRGLQTDPDLRVRTQLAFSLGGRSNETLTALVKQDPANKNLLIAALPSSPNHPEASNWQKALQSKPQGAVPALQIITNKNPNREKVVAAYAGVPALKGNPVRGRAHYVAFCSACHRLKNEGHEIGPDLGTVAAKPDEQLLEAILDPNRAVEQRYLTHTVLTKDGKAHVGLLAEETANSLTLKLAGNTEVILRADIAKSSAGTQSLMPEGLESVLKPQDVADILAWMRAK